MEWTFDVRWLTVPAQILFVMSAVALLVHTLWVGFKVAWYKARTVAVPDVPVSVIIAARNEADNLRSHLPAVFNQQYPDFEVVVVNDASDDDTDQVLKEFSDRHPNLRVVNVPKNDRHDGGKKLAVTLGIKAAKYNRLLFTDADCEPASPHWIRTVVSRCPSPDGLVLGYSPYRKGRGFLNAVIRTDAWITAMDYFGMALAGVPYMGVGRNLSYDKDVFFEVGGFRTHYALASGDDDLFVNQVATPKNTGVCLEPDGHTVSLPKNTWKAYWHQKRRHLTTGHRYKKKHRCLLMVKPLAVFVLIVSAAILLATNVWTIAVAAVLGVLLLLRWLVFCRSVKWLGQGDILIFAPVMEVAVLFGTAAAHLANAFSKPSQWKK